MPEPCFDRVAVALHWSMAILIAANFCLGLYMTTLDFTPRQLRMFSWHKWAGVTVLGLAALRLLWRLTHRPPMLPPRIEQTMPRWAGNAHLALHRWLYLLFFAVPLSGWAYSSALGIPVVWFGVLPLPDFVPVDQPFAKAVLQPLHHALAFTLGATVLVHVGAVLKHQLVDRNNLLARMWPALSKRPTR